MEMKFDIKRSWPVIAAGIVLILLISGVAFWYAISGTGRKPVQAATGNTEATSTMEMATSTQVVRALDGVMVAPGMDKLQSFAVMIDNHPDARPQSGLSRANVVYEMPVEGGMTRFMAVFDASTTADMIGPVRSARLYFAELVDSLHLMYGHVGGSPEALEWIKNKKGFEDLNEFWNGKYYWRSAKRAAPHNVYTRMDELNSALVEKNWTAKNPPSWVYDDATSTKVLVAKSEVIHFAAVPDIQWSYDATTQLYARLDGGIEKKDADGTAVRAANVLVLHTESQTIDDYGRLKVRMTGSGPLEVYRDGRKIEGTWHRSTGEGYRFETVQGTDLALHRGTSWVEVVDLVTTSSTAK